MGCYQTLIPYISIGNCNSELIFGMRASLRILYKNMTSYPIISKKSFLWRHHFGTLYRQHSNTDFGKQKSTIVKTKEAINQTYFFNAYSVSCFCVNSIDKYCIIQSDFKLASPFKRKQENLISWWQTQHQSTGSFLNVKHTFLSYTKWKKQMFSLER